MCSFLFEKETMIFWDLDGPILDVKEKYYNVYKDILLKNEDTPLPQK